MPTPRLAAAVILHRSGSPGLEVFLVERSRALRFFGGYLAFPGGAVDPGDAELVPAAVAAAAGVDRALLGAAVREIEEEVSLRIDPSALKYVVRFVTPPISRERFDTAFFLAEAPGEPRVVPGELAGGAWWRPGDLLERWRLGEVRVAPPVLTILEILAARGLEEAVRELRSFSSEFEGCGRAIRSAPGYEFVPLTAPPLPPENPTNSILVGGRRFILIDPAPRGEKSRGHLFEVIDRRREAGDELIATVITHHHPDHVGALAETADRYRSPVWGHARAEALIKRPLDRRLEEGDEIDLGSDPSGRGEWKLRALHTPGHAVDHLSFYDERTRSLVLGDLLSTVVSMYVGSPGGNLREYFASLERIRALEVETFYPSHGAPGHDLARLVDETLRHRRERLEEVAGHLQPAKSGGRPRETKELSSEIYSSVNPALRPLFERATRAALEYLVEEGRAERAGEDSFRGA